MPALVASELTRAEQHRALSSVLEAANARLIGTAEALGAHWFANRSTVDPELARLLDLLTQAAHNHEITRQEMARLWRESDG